MFVINASAVEMMTHFLEVSIAIYQADLYFLTMPLLVNAVRRACSVGLDLKISSEPPAANGPRKCYGDIAIYEIVDPKSFMLRCIVELRTEQAPCPLKSVLVEAHHSMLFGKASSTVLVIAVASRSLAIRTAEVKFTGDNDNLNITKFVEFSLTNRRTLEIDLSEASEFVWQVSQWLIEYDN